MPLLVRRLFTTACKCLTIGNIPSVVQPVENQTGDILKRGCWHFAGLLPTMYQKQLDYIS